VKESNATGAVAGKSEEGRVKRESKRAERRRRFERDEIMTGRFTAEAHRARRMRWGRCASGRSFRPYFRIKRIQRDRGDAEGRKR
jgi:hypothetical protein